MTFRKKFNPGAHVKSDIKIPKRQIFTKDFHVKKKDNGDVTVEGFANAATVDRGGEILTKDVWDLKNFEKNGPMLFNHDWNQIIGSALKTVPEEKGLYFEGIVAKSNNGIVPYVRDMISEGHLKTFSVGFDDHNSEYVENNIIKFKKAELLEVSAVTIPMNADSTFEVKKASDRIYRAKSYYGMTSEIARQKGHFLAAGLNQYIHDKTVGIEGFDVEEAMAKVKELSGLDEMAIKNILCGETKDVPEAFLKAFSLAFMVNTRYLMWDAEDDKYYSENFPIASTLQQSTSTGEGESNDSNDKSKSSIRAKAATDSSSNSGEGEENSTEEAQAVASKGAEEGDVPSSTEDVSSKANTEPESDDQSSVKEGDSSSEEGESQAEGEASNTKDFQSCVAEKIPGYVSDGKEPAEAVSLAFEACESQKGCPASGAKALEEIQELMVNKGKSSEDAVMAVVEKHSELEPHLESLLTFSEDIARQIKDLMTGEPGQPVEVTPKQAEQNGEEEGTGSDTPVASKASDDFGNPQLDNMKQQLSQLGAMNVKMDSVITAIADFQSDFAEKVTKATTAIETLSEMLGAIDSKSAEEGESGEEDATPEDEDTEVVAKSFLDEMASEIERLNASIEDLKKN